MTEGGSHGSYGLFHITHVEPVMQKGKPKTLSKEELSALLKAMPGSLPFLPSLQFLNFIFSVCE